MPRIGFALDRVEFGFDAVPILQAKNLTCTPPDLGVDLRDHPLPGPQPTTSCSRTFNFKTNGDLVTVPVRAYYRVAVSSPLFGPDPFVFPDLSVAESTIQIGVHDIQAVGR